MRGLKTAFLLTALTLLLVIGGQALGGEQGMTLALGMAILMNGGPGTVWGPRAYAAFREFADEQ